MPAPAARTADRSARLREIVEQIGRGRIVAAEPARWGFSNDTTLVTLADGRRLAIQLLVDRATARRRARLGPPLAVRLEAAGIPTAALLTIDAGAPDPYAVHAAVDGMTGAELLESDDRAVQLGALMGALLPRFARVEAGGLRLPSTWADPVRLAAASRRRLARVAGRLDPATTVALNAGIEALATRFLGRQAVFAHGDFAPVNVVVGPGMPGISAQPERHGEIAALLDLETARRGDPLLDAAWWSWVVRHHHPDRWRVAWPAFCAAASIDDDPDRIRSLQLLRLLEELAAATARGRPAAARRWARRLIQAAAWPPA